jgi:molecular chaperone IbpA
MTNTLTLRSLDIPSIHKFGIGFDNIFDDLLNRTAQGQTNYPPYNIIKHDYNHYTIELAVAGFGQQDIDIEMEDGKLVVRGNIKADDTLDNFLVRGIANRAFTRAFAIDDHIEVKDAEMFNGMLKIFLERLIPEEKKPKKIAVKSRKGKELLQENAYDQAAEKL